MRKLIIILAVIIIILLGVLFFYNPAQAPSPSGSISGQQSSAQPQLVTSADGRLKVSSLHNGDLITSPLTITGTVTGGGWFFESTFPVKVADADGRIIGIGVAQAQANWMSTSSVPFTAIIDFTAPTYATGTVLLEKDNPSGAPANDATLSISVRFK